MKTKDAASVFDDYVDALTSDGSSLRPIATWIPTARNPSKLIQHRWDYENERWVETPFAMFVPSKSFRAVLKARD